MGQTLTPTKLASTSKPNQEVAQKEGKLASESEPEPVLTPKGSESPQPTALDDMAATARQILSENLDIAQRMLEHLKS